MSDQASERLIESLAGLTGMCLVAGQACGDDDGWEVARLSDLFFEVDAIRNVCVREERGDEGSEYAVDIQHGNRIFGYAPGSKGGRQLFRAQAHGSREQHAEHLQLSHVFRRVPLSGAVTKGDHWTFSPGVLESIWQHVLQVVSESGDDEWQGSKINDLTLKSSNLFVHRLEILNKSGGGEQIQLRLDLGVANMSKASTSGMSISSSVSAVLYAPNKTSSPDTLIWEGVIDAKVSKAAYDKVTTQALVAQPLGVEWAQVADLSETPHDFQGVQSVARMLFVEVCKAEGRPADFKGMLGCLASKIGERSPLKLEINHETVSAMTGSTTGMSFTSSLPSDIHAVTMLVSAGDEEELDWCQRWLSSFATANKVDRVVFVTEGLCSVTCHEVAQVSPDVLGVTILMSRLAEAPSGEKDSGGCHKAGVQQFDVDARSPTAKNVRHLRCLITGATVRRDSKHITSEAEIIWDTYDVLAVRDSKVFTPFWVQTGRAFEGLATAGGGLGAPFPSFRMSPEFASEVQRILHETCVQAMRSIVDPDTFRKASRDIDALAKRSLSAAANSVTSQERDHSMPSYLQQLLERYRTDGSSGNGARDLKADAYDAQIRDLLCRSPELGPSISLLANVVGKHREIFLGQLHPLQVLFAKTKTSPQQQHANRTTGQAVTGGATDVYTEAVLARVHKGVIKAAVAHLCSLAVNQSRQLRILEVGAGTGSTALPVLELLTTDYPGVCVEYAFTDLGTHFVNAFGKKYSAEYDFLRPAPLDIAKDPRTQGFASSEYDIVICVNVLHATQDIGVTLSSCETLLAPGGVLLLQEITTQTSAFLDATFGLTEGWWAVSPSDPLRPGRYPTLDAQAWQRAFQSLGFAWSASTPGSAELGLDQQAVFVAQKAHAHEGNHPGHGQLSLSTSTPPTPPQDNNQLLVGSGTIASFAAEELVRAPGSRHVIWARPQSEVNGGDETPLLELARNLQVRVSLIHVDNIKELQVFEVLDRAGVPSSSIDGVVWVPDQTTAPMRLFATFQHLHVVMDNLDKSPEYFVILHGVDVESELGGELYNDHNRAVESLVLYRRHRLSLPTGLIFWPLDGERNPLGRTLTKKTFTSAVRSCGSKDPRVAVVDFAKACRKAQRANSRGTLLPEARGQGVRPGDPPLTSLESQPSSSAPAPVARITPKRERARPNADQYHGLASQANSNRPQSTQNADVHVVIQRVLEEARALTSSPGAVTTESPLMMAGVDSLAVVELREALLRTFPGVTLASTYIYELPTSKDIGEEIHAQLLDLQQQRDDGFEDEASSEPSSSFIPTPDTSMSRTTTLPLSRGGPTPSDGRRSSYFPLQSDDAPEDKRIAVIAMECRMPGGMNTSAEFWEGLQLGTDAMVDIPLSRFDTDMVYDSYDNATRGTSYVRRGGFLDRAEYFDLARFNIPAAQLEQMDPQQRILLEVVDEALQQAGYDHQDVQGTDVSVYIGVSSKDWAKVAPRDGAYLGTGIAGSIVSNRISFELGLTGTSMSIDTACSSSLVAVDLAVQALRQGATDMAIAGGINLNLHPDPYVVLCGSRMLSPDGTCKTLDASADGYARSEGCGVVLLKRLPDALRDGDPIVGVLTGSYSNQDGRSTNISAPNGKAQQQLVRRALQDAGRSPDDVDYVEMHGTGTSLGDPVEVHALKGVFGMARSANNSLNKDSKGLGRSQRQLPLWLGAVKSNVGHLEPAAGMAGLIKTLWVVKERQVPPNIHMNKINPGIDFTGFEMSRIPQRPERIQKEAGDVVVAGCSSFGFGGTNVHVVVESPPPHQPRASIKSKVRPKAVLNTNKKATACHSADRIQSTMTARPPKTTDEVLVVAFTGQGSQSAGMARNLYGKDDKFTSAVDECLELASREGLTLSADLLRVLIEPADAIEPAVLSQTSLFVFEFAVYQSLASRGLVADIVVGHSIGEIAAAVAAGCLSLTQGLQLVCHRAAAMEAASGPSGTMYALMVPHGTIEEHIAELQLQDSLAVAAVNGYSLTTVSGSEKSMQLLIQALGPNITATRLDITKPFHSPLMASCMPGFMASIKDLTSQPPGQDGKPRMWSTVTGGELVEGPTAEYWRRHALGTVLYEPAVRSVSDTFAGKIRILEAGPKPVLCAAMQRWARVPADAPTPVSLLGFTSVATKSAVDVTTVQMAVDANQDHVQVEQPALQQAAASDTTVDQHEFLSYKYLEPELDVPGGRDTLLPDCNALLVGQNRSRLDREREGFYPWRRGYHALMTSPRITQLDMHTHAVVFQANHRMLSLVSDHVVRGRPIMPGAAIFDMALGAVQVIEGLHPVEALPLELRDTEITRAVVFAQDLEPPWLRVVYHAVDGTVRVQSAPGERDEFIDHASGTIVRSGQAGQVAGRPGEVVSTPTIRRLVDLEAVAKRCTREANVPSIRAQLASRGLKYGPQFQALTAAVGGEGECLGTLQLPENGSSGYIVHPGLFDSAMQSCSVTVGQMTGKDAFAVGGIGRLRVYAFLGEHRKGATVKVWSRIIRSDPSSAEANLDICNNDGNILFTIEQLRLVKISSLAASTPRSCLYVTEWAPLQPSAEQTLTACLGLDDLHDNKTGEEEKLDLQIQLDHVVGVISGPKRRHAGRRRGLVSALEGELDRLLGRQQGLRYLDLDLLSSSRGSAGLLGAQSLQTLVVPLDPSDTALSTASRLARLFQTLHASTSSRNKDEENLLAQLRTVVVVTFGSQALVHDDLGDGEVQDASGVESSAAWGLLRTARLEFPQLRLVMVDVDPDHHPVRQAAAVLDAFHDESEDEVVWRGHCRYVPRLTDLGVDVEAGGGRAAGLDIFRPSVDVDLAEILPRDVELGQAVPIGISRSELARIRRGYALTNTLSLDSLICGVKAIPEDQVVPLQKELWQRYANVSFDRDSSDLHAQLPAVGCSDEGLDAWFDEALRSHPEVAPELNMLRPLYRQHEAVFRGDKDPLELLFRSNQHAETAGVYSESFYAQYYNRVVVHAFSSYARNWLAGGCGENDATPEQSRPMRILEVGAGSGSTSRRLLEAAAELGLAVDYYFTDISETFLRKASGDKTITATTGAKVTFTLFNAEIDPRSQGLASSTFDVVVGVNVIHATQNLYETMRHVRQLVRPRGIVILSEIVQPSSISDATFGMTEGWWRFQDRDLRPDYPLMDAARWERLLHATDFDMVRILENAEAGTAQAVVVGQAAMCSWPVTRLPTTLSSVDQAGNTGDQGVYIITGGTGGLGLLTAAVLLEQRHCDKVYLLSRSGSVLPNSAHVWERLEGLAGQGQVVKLACDVSSASQVADVFDSIRQKGEYIRGIVHSSGVLRDAMLQNQTRATMTPVFGAKVEALRWLHDLSLDEPRLRHFVIFSSASALLGSPGQANHSSANTFLDAFAAHRRAQGLPALCLQWGTVMGLGEAARKGANKLAIKFGHGQLSETAAEAVLKTVFASDGHLTPVHSLAVSPFDWNTFTKSRTKVPHITRSFTSKISPKTTAQSPATLTASSKQSTTSSTSGPVRREASSSITEMIQSCVEATISHKMPDESTTFYDAGVDSLSAIELRNRLQSRLGNKAKLSASLVFDYPTLEKLREYLESITTGAEDDEPGRVNDVDTDPILQDDLQTPALRQNHSPGQASTSLKSLQSAPEPQIQVQARPAITVIKGATGTTQNTVDKTVSIVGMDCRLPTAGNVNELWESLLAGKDGFRDIPFSRWDLDDNFYTPKSENKISRSYVKQGAFLTPQHLEWFDNRFFNISDAEARTMDPNQRLLLEVCYQALADAGYTRKSLRGQKIGVFVGFMNYDQFFLADKSSPGAFTASSASPAALSNRVSHVLGLEGPSCTIDTACSASLYALNMAVGALRSNQCDAAVVAGVNVMMSPAAFVAECAAGMLSPSERCHALDTSADGFARGEGCAAVVLQRLARPEPQSVKLPRAPRVYANILGTAVGHDGTAANLTSPNGPAQARIIRRALDDAGVGPETITFVEGHFTGTVLGDPIEFHALKGVFGGKEARNAQARSLPLQLGALKSNLGHLEGVAGVAGLIKAVLALGHRQLPPVAHLKELNPHLVLEDFGVSVPRGPGAVSLAPTSPACSHLRAGVSSFGFSGANAHVVLEGAGRPTHAHDQKSLAGQAHSFSRRHFPLRRPGSCHAMLGNVQARLPEEGTLHVPIGFRLFSLIQQHVVKGVPTLPGAMLVELATAVAMYTGNRAAGKPRSAQLDNIFFIAPFTVETPRSVTMTITHDSTGEFTIEKESQSDEDDEMTSIVMASGKICTSEPVNAEEAPDRLTSMASFQDACTELFDVKAMWKSLEAAGIHYSGHFRSLQRAYVSCKESNHPKAFGHISITENGEDGFVAHPAILDSAMQLVAALVLAHREGQPTDSSPRQTFLPFSMKGVRVNCPGPRESPGRDFSALAELFSVKNTEIKAKLSVLDESGKVVFDIDEVTFRPLSSSSSAGPGDEPRLLAPPLHSLVWQQSQHGPKHVEDKVQQCLLLIHDEDQDLANVFTDGASNPVRVTYSTKDIEQSAPNSTYCILPASLKATELSCWVLDLVKILTDQTSRSGTTSSLWIVTRSCQTAPYDYPEHAAIWGLVRCLRLEDTSGLSIGLCDLVYGSDEATPPPAAAFASSLVGRLPVPTRSSNEWAWISSSSSWLEPRLVPDHTTSLELPTAAIAKRGLNSLEAAPLPDFDSTLAQRLDDDSVLVCVQAAGINFHDVVFATYGATSEAMDDGSALGVDFSGVVQAVGSKVDHVRPGDSVFGMADGSIRSVLVCHGSLLRKLEPGCGLSVQEAASLPTIFATAHFILRHVADVRAGQTMLIHTATGGLGHVLVHMAQDLGARVVATAGSEEKQRYLADELGVDPGLIATSRDAGSFSERLGHLVSQVDVAINTLSGDYIPETLSLLKPGGMFFETGKLAIWTPEEVKSSRPDVEYHVVHLTQPELLSQFLGDLKDALSQGAVRAPRIESFQYPAQLKEAFEHVRNAQHIGKVVLTMPDAPGKRILCPLQSSVDDAVRRGDENRVRDDATYIVTGGNSGLGLVAARVLVDAGALHIVLLSRSGVVRDLDAHVHAEIEKVAAQTGCNLQHWACDVGDKAELERIILHVQRDGMPPIRGVIHAAGVLHDAPFRQQTNSFMEVVMRPKIQGAQNIMDLLKSSLDFLILFSSPAGLIGTVDQANYGAANAVLDAIAGGWRTNGLPVVSVAWGLVVGLGILTQRPPTRALVERLGLVSPDLVYRALRAAIVEATTTAGCAYKMVAPVQWEKLLRPGGDQRALFAEYQRLLALQRQQQPRRAGAGKSRRLRNSTRRTGTTSSANAAQSNFPESLASIETTMRQVLSDVVAVDIPEGSRDTRLDDLGMDSLSSMELGNRLNAAFSGLNLSPMAVHSFPTLGSLAQHIYTKLSMTAAAAGPGLAGLPALVAADGATERSLVELNQVPDDNNPETPVGIIIHGASGEVHHARTLAAKLPFKVYGIRQTSDTPSHSVAAMAASYINLLVNGPPGILRRRVQLMGYSFGGCVAWEMARMLDMDGPFRPERLLLLDGGPCSDVSMAAVLGADISMAAGQDDDEAIGPHSMALMGTLLFASGAEVVDKAEIVSTLEGLGLTGSSVSGLADVESIRRAREDIVQRIPEQLRGDPLRRMTDGFVANCASYDRYLLSHRAGKVPVYDGPVWISRSRLPRGEEERTKAQLWLDSDHYGFMDRDELSDAIIDLVGV